LGKAHCLRGKLRHKEERGEQNLRRRKSERWGEIGRENRNNSEPSPSANPEM
jgi:hypothetical protein